MSDVATWDKTMDICIAAIANIERECGDKREMFQTRLMDLHSHHAERFLADNERIWQTGAILIPSAGAGLFAVGSLHNDLPAGLLLLAVASIAIIYLWHCLAEQHRMFQTTHSVWLQAIERRLGVMTRPSSKTLRPNQRRPVLLASGERPARVFLVAVIILIWTVLGSMAVARMAGWTSHTEGGKSGGEPVKGESQKSKE